MLEIVIQWAIWAATLTVAAITILRLQSRVAEANARADAAVAQAAARVKAADTEAASKVRAAESKVADLQARVAELNAENECLDRENFRLDTVIKLREELAPKPAFQPQRSRASRMVHD